MRTSRTRWCRSRRSAYAPSNLAQAVDGYRKAAELSRTQYEAGKSSFLDVLDAERSLYSAEDSLIQSRVSIAKD